MLSKVQTDVLTTAELGTVNMESQPMPETPTFAFEYDPLQGYPI